MNGIEKKKPAKPDLKVLSFPASERPKRVVAFERSMDSLTETMSELFLVEKMTGRKGLPQRVYLAFSDALHCAMKLAEVQK